MSAKSNGTRAAKNAARRALIIESAAALFVEKGFHLTSMRDIAGRAGISLGNLYNHFQGKTDIIAAIAALDAEEMAAHAEALDAAQPGEPDHVRKFIHAYFTGASNVGNAALAAEITAEAFRDPAVDQLFSEARLRIALALSHHLEGDSGTRLERAHLMLDLLDAAATRVCGATRAQKEKTLSEILAVTAGFFCNS